MKHLIFTTMLFTVITCTACNSNNANATSNKQNSAPDNSISSSSTGDAVFSYNLDGIKISGGKVDELVMNNAAFITPNDNGNKLSFFLNDAYKNDAETFPHSLRFAVPGKTGSVTIASDDDNYSVQLFLATGEEGKYLLYANEAFTVTVSNVSATRVSGTFSGKLKLVESTGKGKDEFTITDGKFDIPISHTK